MHSYSIDTDARKWAYLILALMAFVLPVLVGQSSSWLNTKFSVLPLVSWPVSFGATFGGLFCLFNKYVWRMPIVSRLHEIPDLQGTWEVAGIGSFQEDPITHAPSNPFSMTVTIRQTFTQVEVFAETGESTSRSTLAGICVNHVRPVFRYAFENTPKNKSNQQLHRHPGLVELRVNAVDELQGDYFSGKHRLRYGEMTFRRQR